MGNLLNQTSAKAICRSRGSLDDCWNVSGLTGDPYADLECLLNQMDWSKQNLPTPADRISNIAGLLQEITIEPSSAAQNLLEEIWFYIFIVVAFLKPQNKEMARLYREQGSLLFDCKNSVGEVYLVNRLSELIQLARPSVDPANADKQAVRAAVTILTELGLDENYNYDLHRRIDRAFKRDKLSSETGHIEITDSGIELRHYKKNADRSKRSIERYLPDTQT